MEVRLALSPKQHSALRLGRKVRIAVKHLHGSGVPYIVRPETYDRIAHAFERSKGVDLALEPSEIHASGGSLTNKLKRGAKVLKFIGEEIYQPIAKAVAPVAKPIIGALTQLGVSKIDNMRDPSARYLNVAEKSVDIFNQFKHPAGPDASGQTTDYLAKANAAAVIANAFTPFAAPAAPAAPPSVGTYTAPVPYVSPRGHPVSTVSTGRRGGKLYLGHVHGNGLGAVGAPPIDVRKIIRSELHAVGFLQQLPIVFKDSARIGAGVVLF
jgi:hypothetical protein